MFAFVIHITPYHLALKWYLMIKLTNKMVVSVSYNLLYDTYTFRYAQNVCA